MEMIRFMPKIQKNESKIHYQHKVMVLAYCDKKRTMKQIKQMFEAIDMEISKRSLRYILKDLVNRGFISKKPNLNDLRGYIYEANHNLVQINEANHNLVQVDGDVI